MKKEPTSIPQNIDDIRRSRPRRPDFDGHRYEIWLNRTTVMTAEEINALPEKLRDYIHDLSTKVDPAGDIRQIASLREQRDALLAWVNELKAELDTKEKELANRNLT